MALSSHLEAVLNGMFLVLLGLLWPHIELPNAWGVTAAVLIVYSAYANWAAALLAAAWGAGRKLAPIAAGDHEASAVGVQSKSPDGLQLCGVNSSRHSSEDALVEALFAY